MNERDRDTRPDLEAFDGRVMASWKKIVAWAIPVIVALATAIASVLDRPTRNEVNLQIQSQNAQHTREIERLERRLDVCERTRK